MNVFINKLIFNQAVYLRFIVPFTENQIKENRGNEVRNQLAIIQKMINTDYQSISHSIFPVLLQCRPGNQETDIEVYRDNLWQTFNNFIEMQRKTAL